MNYLEYLSLIKNWLRTPIDKDKHPVYSSWTSGILKETKNNDKKTSSKSNKNTSSNSNDSRSNSVVNINVDRQHPDHQGTIGRVKYNIHTEYHS